MIGQYQLPDNHSRVIPEHWPRPLAGWRESEFR